jgi:hypothetical protein
MKREKKSKIDNVWELAKTPETLSLAQKSAEKLINNDDLIIFCGDRSENFDQYSFYRIYNKKGEYKFALPGWIELEETRFESFDTIITKPSSNPAKSRNGGEYHEGFRVEKIPKREIFRVTFSWALMSDFEDECSEKPVICTSVQEVAEITGENIKLEVF